MAQTLTTADLVDVQALIDETYSGNTPSKYPYNAPVMSARAILANTSGFTQSDVVDQRGKYRGKEINWLLKGTSPIKYNGTPGSNDQACAIGTSEAAESNSKTYDNNVSIIARVEVDDDLYENLYEVQQVIAERFMSAYSSLRETIEARLITFLAAGKTPINNDSSLPDGITFNGTDDVFEVDTTTIDLQNPDGLTDLDALAANNDLGSFWYLTGRFNFYNSIVNAPWRSRNADEAFLTRFSDPSYRIFTDPRTLDNQLGGKNTLIVGDGTYAVWDFVHPVVTSTPTQIEDNKWQYFVEDPSLMINVNGVMRPVRYNVYYTRECTSVNKTVGLRTFKHKFEIFFLGGAELAPASEDTHTGILQIKGVGV